LDVSVGQPAESLSGATQVRQQGEEGNFLGQIVRRTIGDALDHLGSEFADRVTEKNICARIRLVSRSESGLPMACAKQAFLKRETGDRQSAFGLVKKPNLPNDPLVADGVEKAGQ